MAVSQIISLLITFCLFVFGGIMIIKKSKNYSTLKWLGLFVLLTIAMTWIFDKGMYENATEFISTGKYQQGLIDIPYLLHQSLNLAGDKLVFLLVLGAFYGVLFKNEGYKKLVYKIANKFEDKEIPFVLIVSLLISLLTSLYTQTFASLIFIPFIISILLNMNIDKISAFAITFGSILIGILASLYGGEGLYWFNQYASTNVSIALIVGFCIYIISYLIFNAFVVLRLKKVLKKKKINDLEFDPFVVENINDSAKTKGIVTLFIILFILMFVGFINWNLIFQVDVISKIKEFLFNIHISIYNLFSQNSFTSIFNKMMIDTNSISNTILRMIMGSHHQNYIIGSWSLYHASIILIIISGIISLFNKNTLDDYINDSLEGIKKILKPTLIFIFAYLIMLIAYASPFIPTINELIVNGNTEFSLFKTIFIASLSNFFHIDFGWTGYMLGTYYITSFPNNIDLIYTIFITTYGLVGFIIPTSGILVLGLTYLNIDIKEWFKFIWKFILIMMLVLLLIFIAI